MPHTINWKNSLTQLVEGNQRFKQGVRSIESFTSALKLQELAEKGQKPSAVILTCSDSRVPTEILFDKGVGDLFVIRVAGNVISDSIIASIEYAVLALGTPLCVVMGHTKCGAVKAAVDLVSKGAKNPTENIGLLLNQITPAVKTSLKNCNHDASEDYLTHQSIIQNIKNQVNLIKERSGTLREACEQGNFQIMGALYDLHEGYVDFEISNDNNQPVSAIIEESRSALTPTHNHKKVSSF